MFSVTTQNLNSNLRAFRIIGRGDIANQGIADGINKSLPGARDGMYREIQKELGTNISGFRGVVRFQRATKVKQFAIIVIPYRNTIGLSRYTARKVQSGVTVQVYKRTGRKLVSQGRAWRLNVRGKPIVLRDPDTGAIVTLKGPSVPGAFRDRDKQDQLIKHINRQRVDVLIARQLQFRIRRAFGR